jgi:hypothetical protein
MVVEAEENQRDAGVSFGCGDEKLWLEDACRDVNGEEKTGCVCVDEDERKKGKEIRQGGSKRSGPARTRGAS